MSETEKVTPEKIMRIGLGFWASKTLLSAIGMGLFTELSNGPLSARDLAGRLGLHSRSARDFFDALLSLGFLERDDDLYRNTAESDLFLVRTRPSYVGGMLEMCNDRLYAFWGSLTEGLRTGLPQNEVKSGGPGLFETLYADPDRLRSFLGAMTGLSLSASKAIAEKFPWRDYRTVVDVGGAQGGLLVEICRAHPHLSGTNFDLPTVGPIFNEYVLRHGLSDRIRFQPGDFFKEPLPATDVITMGHILHDWNIEEKRMLVDKAHRALPEGGALLVFEALIDDERRVNSFGLLMSLNMLIETPGGFDFTGRDCSEWMREAGFRETRVEHLVGFDSMVVGIK